LKAKRDARLTKVNQSSSSGNLAERISSPVTDSIGPDPSVNAALLTDYHVWSIDAEDTQSDLPECKIPIVNMSITKSNHFFHDSGANRHIAHDRDVFDQYYPTQPLKVSAFGDKLATHAIGYGTINLKSVIGNKTYTVALRNVLHIPAARFNLVSQFQLDKAGISAIIQDGKVILKKDQVPVVNGWIQGEMYRLNLELTKSSQTRNAAVAILKASPGFYIA
jgi:hypothetical protein